MTDFIVVISKDVSRMTGRPHLVAVPIDRITLVEQALFEIPDGMDKVDVIEGCGITVQVTDNHFHDVNTRTAFLRVMDLLRIANAKVCD